MRWFKRYFNREPSSSAPALTKITLADALKILDMSLDLPANFKRLDATAEGLSREAWGLDLSWSEPMLLFSEKPFQRIFASLNIIESQVKRDHADTMFKDEMRFRLWIQEGFREILSQKGIEFNTSNIQVTYPKVGDTATLGSDGGWSVLIFKNGKVYVIIRSIYLPGEHQNLTYLAGRIVQRIGLFSQ